MLDNFKPMWLINLSEVAKKDSTKILLYFKHCFHHH